MMFCAEGLRQKNRF